MKFNLSKFNTLISLGFVSLITWGCATTGSHLGEQLNAGQVVEEEFGEFKVKLHGISAANLLIEPQKEVTEIPAELMIDQKPAYRIGPFDVLQVTVYDHPELTLPLGQYRSDDQSGQLVNADGSMYYPYLGRVPVAGKTTEEVRVDLTTQLSALLKDPQIDVKVLAYRSQNIQVAGLVKQPGVYAVKDKPIHLAEAINLAGGSVESADLSRVELSRDGKTYQLSVIDSYKFATPLDKVLLKDGDRIRVPSIKENMIYLLGEVKKPSTVAMNHGELSLTQALTEVGGIETINANASAIYVIRYSKAAQKEINVYHLNADNPMALAIGDHFALEPRDLVFVDANGLARWNRFISLILPTFQLLNSPINTTANSVYLYERLNK